MSKRILVFIAITILGLLVLILMMIVLALYMNTSTLQSEVENLKAQVNSYQQQKEESSNKKDSDEDEQDSLENSIEVKTRRTLLLEGSRFLGGTDKKISVELSESAIISDDSQMGGGGGYVGLRITDENLDIRFGLPYEMPSTKYNKKTKVFTSNVFGDVYRIETYGQGIVFYTNKFEEYIGRLSYCTEDGGNSIDCAKPSLSKNPNSNDGSDSFIVQCELRTERGIANCDEVVKTIRFE